MNGENTDSYWRSKARPIIREIIARCGGDVERRKKELFEAYPFGPRKYHPYKIWLDEVRRQTAPKEQAGPCRCGHRRDAHLRRGKCYAADCVCDGYTTQSLPLFGGSP